MVTGTADALAWAGVAWALRPGCSPSRCAKRSAGVLDDAARDRLADNISGHLLDDVSKPVLNRALQYWQNVDKEPGDRISARVKGG